MNDASSKVRRRIRVLPSDTPAGVVSWIARAFPVLHAEKRYIRAYLLIFQSIANGPPDGEISIALSSSLVMSLSFHHQVDSWGMKFDIFRSTSTRLAFTVN